MLKKRLIGTVIVKNGWAVQSFGYRRYLPLGNPECLVENLDRWGADEIFVLSIDRSSAGLGPDFKLLKRLGQLGLGTPLIYGGGIRSVEDGLQVIKLGADRLCVDALLHDDIAAVRGLSLQLGAQAVIAALPLSCHEQHIEWLDYRTKVSTQVSAKDLAAITLDIVSELLVIDWQHEGQPRGFDSRLIAHASIPAKVPLIAFGGLSEPDQMTELLSQSSIAAVAVGNFLSYGEHAIQRLKKQLIGMPLRLPSYESIYSLTTDV
jgi:cyclase